MNSLKHHVRIALLTTNFFTAACQPVANEKAIFDAGFIAESDFDEPVNQPAIALMDELVWRLKDGRALADLLTPTIVFSFTVIEPCAAVISRTLEKVDAQSMDDGFGFDASYSWENPDCTPPNIIPVWIDFTLSDRTVEWSNVTAAADDPNFEVFYIAPESGAESLLVYLMIAENGLKISRIDFNRAYDVNGKSELRVE